MDLDSYKDLFINGKKNIEPISGLCGRIIRGKEPKDFETLTDDPNRKIIMLMGPDGLERILGKTGYQALIILGYKQDYIEYKISQGFQFKLVIFYESQSIKMAKWDNVVELASKIYPKVKKKIYKRLDELKSTNFKEIEAKSGRNFSEIDKKGPLDSNFMTYDRFRKSKGTLEDVRAFFYHTLHLRELYSGDGYTYNETGERGLMEYIAPNKKLTELGDFRLIDMKIEIANDF